jgi:hypothetical protein
MPTTRRSGRRALVAPAAALGSEAAETLMHIAPHVDAAATLAAQRVVDLSDAAAVALDPALAASSFADAMEAVNGVSSPDAASSAAIVAPERMEGILSPISDRLEAFVLGTQDVFAKQGVPYPLG